MIILSIFTLERCIFFFFPIILSLMSLLTSYSGSTNSIMALYVLILDVSVGSIFKFTEIFSLKCNTIFFSWPQRDVFSNWEVSPSFDIHSSSSLCDVYLAHVRIMKFCKNVKIHRHYFSNFQKVTLLEQYIKWKKR